MRFCAHIISSLGAVILLSRLILVSVGTVACFIVNYLIFEGITGMEAKRSSFELFDGKGDSQAGASPKETDHGDAPGANPTVIVRNRIVWADWMVVALLECKKVEYDEAENTVVWEAIVNSDTKWRRIQSLMRENSVSADITQLRNKWESTIASYKKSLEDPNVGVNPNVIVDPHEQPLPNSEAESQRLVENGADASTICHNSGVKRKNASGKAATLLSNSVTTFTTSMLELVKKRDEREEKLIVAIHDIEKRRRG
ncbi:hypothetical protein R1flu_007156 [Riccia fluitans]|uniref:Nuclear apoptosis-inducing factor 1 n=1 Tax=Riccia fluitans TaxID=41844 RepID=A0ABD1Z259_9MARC